MDAVQSSFQTLLQENGLHADAEALARFERYAQLLVEWNERMNLTGITERGAIYRKHFYDSLSPVFYLPVNGLRNIADIGSGAGFPSLPIKILFPHLHVTIIDSLQKRIQFLKHLTKELGLVNVDCLHSRAEVAGKDPMFRDAFDLVTARAVARLNVLNEYCLPFVRTNGWFAAMKGIDPSEEIIESRRSLHELRAQLERDIEFDLPEEEGKRHILLIKKLGPTPAKYPRASGLPSKQPLV